MHAETQHAYTFSGVEKIVNKVIQFIFYYRLLLVFLSLACIAIVETQVWDHSSIDRWKNFGSILATGSIIIGIFYWILNYEYNHIRFTSDVKTARDTLTFTTALKSQETELMGHFRSAKVFYVTNKELLEQSRFDEVEKLLEDDFEAKTGLRCVLNYFECMAIGAYQGLMDEVFLKLFFKSMFRDLCNQYGTYIAHLQRKHHSDKIYANFMSLSQKWKSE